MNLRSYIVIAGLVLSGCDGRSQRVSAIEEVERACDLPANSLPRSGAEKPAIDAKTVTTGDGKSESRRYIYLGSGFGSRVIEKRQCILRFQSKHGYRFSLFGRQPTTLPD